MKTFIFRLYPNRKQRVQFEWVLSESHLIVNEMLAHMKQSPRTRAKLDSNQWHSVSLCQHRIDIALEGWLLRIPALAAASVGSVALPEAVEQLVLARLLDARSTLFEADIRKQDFERTGRNPQVLKCLSFCACK